MRVRVLHLPPVFVRLAQMVERLPYKQSVGGSIPSPDTSRCPVNSEARVLPCPGRSRGFDSRTGRQIQCFDSAAGSARPWYGRGHRFDPDSKLHLHADIAQMAEQPLRKGQAVGSIPTIGSTSCRHSSAVSSGCFVSSGSSVRSVGSNFNAWVAQLVDALS